MLQRSSYQAKAVSGFWIVSLGASLLVRIPGLYDRANWWRAIQTEMTAYWFQSAGIDLLHYQTPLYGPPWQIPLEFPLYQAAGALIARFGNLQIGFACRLAALLGFYLCALLLYRIARDIFSNSLIAGVIVSLFLWTPYNIYYSTEPLIDYTALALALGYFYGIYRWLFFGSNTLTAALAVVSGSLGMMVKLTSMPVIVIPILVAVGLDLRQKGYLNQPLRWRMTVAQIWKQRWYWLTLALMGFIPLAVGSAWARHADAVKGASIFTQWLTSSRLLEWNFGTWGLRSNPLVSAVYLYFLFRHLAPNALLVFFFGGIYELRRESRPVQVFLIGLLASLVLELAVFLNLFQHLYYYIVFSASMAIFAGYGICRVWQAAAQKKPVLRYVILGGLLASVFLAGHEFLNIRRDAITANEKIKAVQEWAGRVRQYIPQDNWAVVVEKDWEPTIPYALERKTMVVTPRERGEPVCALLADPHFSLVVSLEESADTQTTLACFSAHTEILPGVYQVLH